MTYQWFDYQEEHEALVDSWIDSQAAQFTGFEDGFGDYYRYWRNEPQISLGDNFWVKLIAEDGQPVGVIVVSLNDGEYYIAEYLVAPLRRGQGIGSSALAELLACSADILGVEIQDVEACIFPSNVASQKAFERAGFVFDHAHPDGDAWYYRHTKATGDHYVYLLQCADDTLYCGYTTDLDRRLQTHNDGRGAKYTRSRLPVSLVYFEQCASKSEALKREWAIKKLTRDQKLALIGQKGASSINTV